MILVGLDLQVVHESMWFYVESLSRALHVRYVRYIINCLPASVPLESPVD